MNKFYARGRALIFFCKLYYVQRTWLMMIYCRGQRNTQHENRR